MADVFAKNVATTAAEAAKIVPRAEFRVFGQGVIDTVKARMWNGKTVLFQARRMPAETYFLSATRTRPTSRCATACSTSRSRSARRPRATRFSSRAASSSSR